MIRRRRSTKGMSTRHKASVALHRLLPHWPRTHASPPRNLRTLHPKVPHHLLLRCWRPRSAPTVALFAQSGRPRAPGVGVVHAQGVRSPPARDNSPYLSGQMTKARARGVMGFWSRCLSSLHPPHPAGHAHTLPSVLADHGAHGAPPMHRRPHSPQCHRCCRLMPLHPPRRCARQPHAGYLEPRFHRCRQCEAPGPTMHGRSRETRYPKLPLLQPLQRQCRSLRPRQNAMRSDEREA
mmetsp:Transcript_29493/g.90411  ORF Transcript_29493/g.90411 Transcript_29493/m.90411 type:complete len:237 (-) Transcript_29493:491-1201(-)